MEETLPKPHEVEQMRSVGAAAFTSTSGNSCWIFSPKLNGFRALWDMHKERMFSRNRKSFAIPSEIVTMLPSMKTPGFFLDGELVYDPREIPVDDLLASQPSRVAAQANFEMLNALVRAGPSKTSGSRGSRGLQDSRGSRGSRGLQDSQGLPRLPSTLGPPTISGTSSSRLPSTLTTLPSTLHEIELNHEVLGSEESSINNSWKFVRYFVFDIFYHGDDEAKSKMVLRDRLLMLKRICDAMQRNKITGSVKQNSFFVLMPYYHYDPSCHSQYMAYAASKDHEGIVMRDTTSTYRDKARSMLKDRVFRETTGAVSGVVYNRGGTYLIIKDDKGLRVKVRVANPLVTPVPSNGTVVSFRYHSMTPRGAYMNAVYNGASSKI